MLQYRYSEVLYRARGLQVEQNRLRYSSNSYREFTMIDLHNGDCLEVMDKLIEQGITVDAIITDPPYGTTACKWDSVIDFEQMWLRLNKLLNQMEQ